MVYLVTVVKKLPNLKRFVRMTVVASHDQNRQGRGLEFFLGGPKYIVHFHHDSTTIQVKLQ